MKLTERDQSILAALAVRVRMLTTDQIARGWFSDSGNEVAFRLTRKRLRKLQDVGLTKRTTVLARDLPPLTAPIATWQPGDLEPDHGAIAWKLERRWTSSPRTQSVHILTDNGAKIFGSKAIRMKTDYQATHDVALAEVYIYYLRNAPQQASLWIGEDVLASRFRGGACPDAVIGSSVDAIPQRIIEQGGRYRKERLSHLWQHFEDKFIVEIW